LVAWQTHRHISKLQLIGDLFALVFFEDRLSIGRGELLENPILVVSCKINTIG